MRKLRVFTQAYYARLRLKFAIAMPLTHNQRHIYSVALLADSESVIHIEGL